MRLFIAISLPEKVKNEIEKAQNELRRALPIGSVRWTKREQVHLTLKFLGDVPANRTEALTQSVEEACKKFPPLRLRAARIGFFPNANLPRVIWAGVNDRAGGLPKLQFAIESAVKEFGTQGPEKTFIGHITLGRAQNLKRTQAEILARLATGMTARVFGEWTAGNVEIIRSQLSSGSPQYSQLASIPPDWRVNREKHVEMKPADVQMEARLCRRNLLNFALNRCEQTFNTNKIRR